MSKNVFGEGVENKREEEEWRKSTISPLLGDQVLNILVAPLQCYTRPTHLLSYITWYVRDNCTHIHMHKAALLLF